MGIPPQPRRGKAYALRKLRRGEPKIMIVYDLQSVKFQTFSPHLRLRGREIISMLKKRVLISERLRARETAELAFFHSLSVHSLIEWK